MRFRSRLAPSAISHNFNQDFRAIVMLSGYAAVPHPRRMKIEDVGWVYSPTMSDVVGEYTHPTRIHDIFRAGIPKHRAGLGRSARCFGVPQHDGRPQAADNPNPAIGLAAK